MCEPNFIYDLNESHKLSLEVYQAYTVILKWIYNNFLVQEKGCTTWNIVSMQHTSRCPHFLIIQLILFINNNLTILLLNIPLQNFVFAFTLINFHFSWQGCRTQIYEYFIITKEANLAFSNCSQFWSIDISLHDSS